MMQIFPRDIAAIIVAYVLGGIPFSYLITRWRAGVNIYEHGEGNVGARNVYHVVGPRWGVLAAALDIAKGTVACLVANQAAASHWAVLACGFAAPLGHNFSPFIRFRGGKGVGTTLGFLLGLLPLPSFIAFLIAIGIYAITRNGNKMLNFGIPFLVILPPILGAPLWTAPYVICLFMLPAIKKLLDRGHEREVWARDPWLQGQPGLYAEASEQAKQP